MIHKLRKIVESRARHRWSPSCTPPNHSPHITTPSLLNPYLTADLEVGRASAAESLDGENLVIEVVCLTGISTALDITLAWSLRSRTEKP